MRTLFAVLMIVLGYCSFWLSGVAQKAPDKFEVWISQANSLLNQCGAPYRFTTEIEVYPQYLNQIALYVSILLVLWFLYARSSARANARAAKKINESFRELEKKVVQPDLELQRKLDEVRGELSNLRVQYEKLQQEHGELQGLIEESVDAAVLSEMKWLREQLTQAQNELRVVSGRLQTEQRDSVVRVAEIARKDDEIRRLREQDDRLQEDLREKTGVVQSLQEEIVELRIQWAETKAPGSAADNAQELARLIEQVGQQVVAVQKAYEGVTSVAEGLSFGLTPERQALLQEIIKLAHDEDGRLASMVQQVARTNRLDNSTLSEVSRAATRLAQNIDRLAGLQQESPLQQISTLRQAKAQLEERLANLPDHEAYLALATGKAKVDSENERLRAELDSTNTLLESLQGTVDALTRRLDSLDETRQEAQGSLESIQEFAGTAQQLSGEIHTLAQALDKTGSLLEAFQPDEDAKIDELTKHVRRLASRLRTVLASHGQNGRPAHRGTRGHGHRQSQES